MESSILLSLSASCFMNWIEFFDSDPDDSLKLMESKLAQENTALKTKVIWYNKEKLVDPTMSNLTNQVC